MISNEQKERRKKGLFASDIPYIMAGDGVRIALQKLGHIEPPNLDDVPSVQLGNILEPPVLDAWERRTGLPLIRDLDTKTHPDHPWLGCHLDGYSRGIVVEAKAYSQFNRDEWGDEGTDEVPIARVWQCMAQMAIVGAEEAHIPVCFVNEAALVEFLTKGTVPIVIYKIPRADDLIKKMIDVCAPVWESIAAGRLPEPVNPGDARLIYRKDNGGQIEATGEIYDMAYALHSVKQHLDMLTVTRMRHEGLIQNFMKAAATLTYQGKTLATWHTSKSESRTFRLKEIK